MTITPLVSLYSGAGGLDLGFAMNGFQPTFANDVDRLAPQSYSEVLRNALLSLDLDPSEHTYKVGDISSQYSDLERNESAVLIGGPPCQGFSRAGRMDPLDPRSIHVRRFLDAVKAVRPRAFVMENVKSLATSSRWQSVLRHLRRRSRDLGYQTRVLVLNAKDFGVPQSRDRMFLIGIRTGEGSIERLTSGQAHSTVTVREALETIQSHPTDLGPRSGGARIVPAMTPVVRTSPFAGMLFNGQGRPLDLGSVSPTISASLGGNHTPIIDTLWLSDPSEGGAQIREYHRSVMAGGNPKVPDTWRRLTLSEAAQLQSFPSVSRWQTPISVSFRHVGNAVPPLLAFEVGRRVRTAMGGTGRTLSREAAGISLGFSEAR